MEPGKIAEAMGLEEAEYLQLLALFIETGKSDLDELRSAIEEGDAKRAGEAIHSLKGAAGNLRLYDIEEISKDIEIEIRAGRLSEISGSVYVLSDKLKEFSVALKDMSASEDR